MTPQAWFLLFESNYNALHMQFRTAVFRITLLSIRPLAPRPSLSLSELLKHRKLPEIMKCYQEFTDNPVPCSPRRSLSIARRFH